MKKLFLSLVAVMVAAVSFAQNTLVATLTHGENITMFYGTYALQSAYNAAVSGDVINLSGGSFQAVDVTKAVTLRGTGIDVSVPTKIVNSFTISIATNDPNRFTMEGIRCQGSIYMRGTYENAYFLKCHFQYISFGDNVRNAMFVNCKIVGNSTSLSGTSSVQLINSYIGGLTTGETSTATASLVNCVVKPYQRNFNWMYRCQLINCIMYNISSDAYALASSSIATNCVAINDNNKMSNVFNNSQTNPNCRFATYADVFKNFTGSYSDSQTFELTDGAKTNFLGTDGTQVGLYGGMVPYTSTPSYPQITKMNVASKTTADGKLSVEIEVSAAE